MNERRGERDEQPVERLEWGEITTAEFFTADSSHLFKKGGERVVIRKGKISNILARESRRGYSATKLLNAIRSIHVLLQPLSSTPCQYSGNEPETFDAF